MRGIKLTHMEAWDFSIGLGSGICISRVENPMGTLSSSLCQILNKGTVGLIPVIGVWQLTVCKGGHLRDTMQIGSRLSSYYSFYT